MLLYSWYIITDYTEVILFNNIVIVCYFTGSKLLLILLVVYYYWLYCGCIITDYTDGIRCKNIVIMCHSTHSILLLIILRWSCLITLWSCATLLIVYYYWLYWYTLYPLRVMVKNHTHVILLVISIIFRGQNIKDYKIMD